MNNSYSPNWDKKINDLLDSHKFKSDGHIHLTAKLGDFTIWVGNYPYSYGTLYNMNRNVSFAVGSDTSGPRPSRYTILRIRKRYKLDIMSQEDRIDYKLKKILG